VVDEGTTGWFFCIAIIATTLFPSTRAQTKFGSMTSSKLGLRWLRMAPKFAVSQLQFLVAAVACVLFLAIDTLVPAHVSALANRTLHQWQGGLQPSFILQDTEGKTISLATAPSAIVIVHFFMTSCEPCREELPALRRLAERSGGDVQIFSIAVAEPDPRVRRFLETMPLNFPVLLDRDRATAKAWTVTSLPTTFILDHNLQARLFIEANFRWDGIEPAMLKKLLAAKETNAKI
jgi:peroxiredoxin